jgi:predicted amino acid-binding ACT domain protein
MEVVLRVAMPDRPGSLATLASTIAEAGVDIAAVDVVETDEGIALDDLVVVLDEARLRDLVQRIGAMEGFTLVHAGPSRGDPGDAVARLALGIESLLNGAMTVDHGVKALIGGLLRADSAELVNAADAPREKDRTIVLAVDHRVLVVRRDYRFTHTERVRAAAIVSACVEAARIHGRT